MLAEQCKYLVKLTAHPRLQRFHLLSKMRQFIIKVGFDEKLAGIHAVHIKHLVYESRELGEIKHQLLLIAQ